MGEHARLMTHRGAVKITRAAFAAIEPPPETPPWKPIKHATLIDTLHEELTARDLKVTREEYAVQRNNALLFGVLDLDWGVTGECTAAMGLRTSNDKSMPLEIAVGKRVFVCDNLAFSGDLIALTRRHTSGLDLRKELTDGLDRYQHNRRQLTEDIERWKNTPVSSAQAKECIYDIFAKKIVPVRLFHPVTRTYNQAVVDTPENQHVWSLHNAFTAHIKTLPHATQFRSTVALGKFFAWT